MLLFDITSVRFTFHVQKLVFNVLTGGQNGQRCRPIILIAIIE